MKKVTIANADALLRLRVIEYYQAGNSQRATAEEFGIHQTTVGEWVKMYQEGGAEALKVPVKPRKKTKLDVSELRAIVSEKYATKVAALIDLAVSGKTNQTAEKHDITPQGLLKWKREYLEGKWEL